MTDQLDLDQLPVILSEVLGAMPAGIADGWRELAAQQPGMSMHPADPDGWIRVDLAGVQFCEVHVDSLADDSERGAVRIFVDGSPQIVDMFRVDR